MNDGGKNPFPHDARSASEDAGMTDPLAWLDEASDLDLAIVALDEDVDEDWDEDEDEDDWDEDEDEDDWDDDEEDEDWDEDLDDDEDAPRRPGPIWD
jgi:hypothetical protein